MGSNYIEEANLRYGGSSTSSSSSSRKGKKTGSNSFDKAPKQPQRGLGVAQLEKIRLQSDHMAAAATGYNYINPNSQLNNPSVNYPITFRNPQEDIGVQKRPYNCSSSVSYNNSTIPSSTSYGFHGPQSIYKMMSKGEIETTYASYGDSQPSLNTRWNAGKTLPGIQHYQQPQLVTRQLLDLEAEEAATGKKKKKARCDSESSGCSAGSAGSSRDSQKLDLELRLSL